MPTNVRCSCGEVLKVADALIGRKAKCPACGRIFDVPAAQPPAAEPRPSGRQGGTEPKEGGRKIGLIAGIGVAAVILVGAVAIGVVTLARKGPSARESTPPEQAAPDREDVAPSVSKRPAPARPARIKVDGRANDWDAAGIAPLEGLAWFFADGGPREGRKKFVGGKLVPLDADKVLTEERRIKSIRIAHDAQDLRMLLELNPGIKERFEQKGSGEYIGHLYVDCDNDRSTGTVRVRDEQSPGWDFHVHLQAGYVQHFVMSVSRTTPTALYLVDKLKGVRTATIQGRRGKFWDTEGVPGGKRDSEKDPSYVAFEGSYLEMRFPLKLLSIVPPADIRLLIEDDDPWPEVAIEIPVSLGK